MATDTLANLVKQYEARIESMYRLSAAAVSASVITSTPVLTGALRASWTPNNGPPVARNVSGGGTRHAVSAVINGLQPGDTFSLANGQPYARRIEYSGWSAKAPAGMVRINIARWNRIVEDALRGS